MKNTLFGFDTLKDFSISCFGIDHPKICLAFSFIAATIAGVSDYLFQDKTTVYTIIGLYLFDFLTGVIYAMKSKTLMSSRLPRVLLNMILMLGLLAIAWKMGSTHPLYALLPAAVVGGIYAILLVSILENLGKLKVLPKKFASFLKNKFGLKVLENIS